MRIYQKVKCPNCKGNVVKTGTDWFNCLICHIGFYLDEATVDPAVKASREYDKFLVSGGDWEE